MGDGLQFGGPRRMRHRPHDTKAYLHHLFKAQELLAMQIASTHNLSFYLRLVTDARHHIEQGDFVEWKRSIIDQLGRRI